ncbi:hypothetical protein LUW74_47160 [Actinomadura madurae]|uniref:hypothetical protein n=1 Tax=Actinomadura madurae TaxID=1993 RepID=UPI002025CF8C|nr:hypothetical protein [Actinomadura madurae]URN10180.1 hypothetical protein LUW74_47160 [Actinomadura madurae]
MGEEGVVVAGRVDASGAVGEGGGEEGDEEGDAFEGEGFGEGGAAGGFEEVELFAEGGAFDEGRGAVVADSGASGELCGDAEEVAAVFGAEFVGGGVDDGGDDGVEVAGVEAGEGGGAGGFHAGDAGVEDGVEEAGAGAEVVGDGGVVALSGEGDDVSGAAASMPWAAKSRAPARMRASRVALASFGMPMILTECVNNASR